MSSENSLTEEELAALAEEGYFTDQEDPNYGAPAPSSKDDIFSFFKHLIEKEDTRKTGNLSKEELGKPTIPVRSLQSIANYAELENLHSVSNFLKKESEIMLSTSLSLKGFLAQLFVTQIRKDKRMRNEPPKTGFFGGGKKSEQQEVGQV